MALILAVAFNHIPTLISWLSPCKIIAEVNTTVVSRLYSRKDIDVLVPPSASLDFGFQELFYEWSLTLLPTRDVAEIALQIDRLEANDRVQVIPQHATLSELHPRWFSGFPEPQRDKPDYYSRTVRFENLPRGQRAVVRIRRQLHDTTLSEAHLIHVGDLRSSGCSIQRPRYNSKADSERLSGQLKTLANWQYDGHAPLALRRDPGDVTPEEVQATGEARCKAQDCRELLIGQLEVHMGKSPDQLFRERQENRVPNSQGSR